MANMLTVKPEPTDQAIATLFALAQVWHCAPSS